MTGSMVGLYLFTIVVSTVVVSSSNVKHLRTVEKVRLSTLSCKAKCLEKYTPGGMEGEFNCFRHYDCWSCWFGCKLFQNNIEAWTMLCSQRSHELCLDGCKTSCRFHEQDNDVDEGHPRGALKTQEIIKDVRYSYDVEENNTNIEWEYQEGLEIKSVILLVGTNKSLNVNTEIDPSDLYILARTYYRNITVDDSLLDMFCTMRLVTIDSERKISLLDIHTEHLKRHTTRCVHRHTQPHHHPPIISSIHVTDGIFRHNMNTAPHYSSSSNYHHSDKEVIQSPHRGRDDQGHNVSSLSHVNNSHHTEHSPTQTSASGHNITTEAVNVKPVDIAANHSLTTNSSSHKELSHNSSTTTTTQGHSESHMVSTNPKNGNSIHSTSLHGESTSRQMNSSSNHTIHEAIGVHLHAAPILVNLSKAIPNKHNSGTTVKQDILKASIRWQPFVSSIDENDNSTLRGRLTTSNNKSHISAHNDEIKSTHTHEHNLHRTTSDPHSSINNINNSKRQPCTKYKVTWKTAVSNKIAGDILTCSLNTTISVEQNSVYHVWVSLFGNETERTEQLTVETAHAQYSKLHSVDACHGCVRGDYTTGVSAALASFIVVTVAIFLLVKSYRSYTRRDHKLRSTGSLLMPYPLTSESIGNSKPTMQMIEPKILNGTLNPTTSKAHITITPILVTGPDGVVSGSSNSQATTVPRSNRGPYEPLSLEDEDANYFVFDLPKSYTAV